MKNTLLDAKHNWYKKEYENGTCRYEYESYSWSVGYFDHNPVGPSYYSPLFKYKEYKIHGRFHRLDGPALEKGPENIREFYIAGIEYDELSYWIKVEELKKTYPNVFEIGGVKYSELDWWTPITE